MSRKLLIINGNPKPESLGAALAERYAEAARGSHTVSTWSLSKMRFEPNLNLSQWRDTPREDDLQKLQEEMQWADHWVIVAPIWWGGVPAQFKGLIDRTLVPGFGFKYKAGSLMPERLLTGRSARVILTMDTPPWYDRLMFKEPGVRQLRKLTLEFCGLKPVKVTRFGPVIQSTEAQRERWLNEVARLGAAGQ